MMKRALVLVSAVALLVAIVAVQMSPQNASAVEAQASHRSEAAAVDVESEGSAPASRVNDVSDVPQTDDGEVGTETGDLPEDEPSVIDTATEFNAPELQAPKPAERLPQEYEDALANWPTDEASEFREYYLAHPDELEFIDAERLIRENEPVVPRFDVRAARSGTYHDPAKECGLKIAMVFDVSGSMNDNDGIGKLKISAKEIVNRLRNTPTVLGLYNFAGEANIVESATMEPKVMSDENASEAISKIDKLKAPNYPDTDPRSATNWEAGLQQVQNKDYDAVFFITDGVPNKPPSWNQNHGVANIVALKAAQIQSEKLAASGTNVIPVFVGRNSGAEVQIPYCKSRGCDKIDWANGKTSPSVFVDPSQRPTGVDYEDNGGKGSNKFSLNQSELNRVQCDKNLTYNYRGIPNLHTYNACTVSINGSKEIIQTKAITNEKRMTDSLSSTGTGIQINSFDELSRVLAEKTRGCESTVLLNKKIVDSKNNNDPTVSKSGWTFTAEKAIDDNGGVSSVTKKTDSDGQAIFKVISDDGTSIGSTFKLTEEPKDGYAIQYSSDTLGVSCTQYDRDGNRVPGSIVFPDVKDPNSFEIRPISRGARYSCDVVNAPAKIDLELKKRVGLGGRYVDADEKGDALDLGKVNANLDVEFEIKNTGAAPLGYLELTDKQIGAEDDRANKPISLQGLRCGARDTVNFRNDEDKTVVIIPGNPLAPGEKMFCRKEGDNSFQIVDLNFQSDGGAASKDKYFGNTGKVVAKREQKSENFAEATDSAWAKAQPGLVIFKSYVGGVPRTVNGVVGQTFNADYNIILTNNGYVDSGFPDIVDIPKPAPGLKVMSVRAYDRDFTQSLINDQGMTRQHDLIVGDGAVLAGSDNDTAWTLRTDQINIMKARHKGNFRLEVTYKVESVLDRPAKHADDRYVCNAVRNRTASNENRGLYNTVDVVTGENYAPVEKGYLDVCYSLVRADSTVTKKINDEGTAVSSDMSPGDQKNNKTISNPEGKDSFKVSYVITNNSSSGRKFIRENKGNLPSPDVKSVSVRDYTLDEHGKPTERLVPVKNLICEGGDVQSTVTTGEEETRISFDTGLGVGKSVTCTGMVDISEIDSDDIHDLIHGDVVKVIPTYNLEAPEQSVFGDQNYPTSDTIIGQEVSDKAWVRLPPASFAIEKSGSSERVAVQGREGKLRKGESFEATYRVKITNNSAAAAIPESIIESPTPMDGLKVRSIRARNTPSGIEGSSQKLLKNDEELVDFEDRGDGTFKLEASNFNSVLGSAEGNTDISATIDVIVSYEVAADNGIDALSDNLECSPNNQGHHGLANFVQLEGDETTGSACIDLLITSIGFEKLINDEGADSNETAAAVIPGAPTVKISYRVTNDGNGDIASFIVSDRYGENADSGERMNIGEMQCDKSATVNVSGPEAAVSPAAALGRGESITCWWNASNPSAMRYNDDSYHVDTATVNATFRQDFIGDIQASDSAWAIQLKSLDGKLPKSGGLGIAPFGLGALILFAGALFISRRQRTA